MNKHSVSSNGGWDSVGMIFLSPTGPMQLVLIPADIAPEFTRALVMGLYDLTRREWKVARLLVSGATRRDMSIALSLSEDVVADALTEIYRKLNVTNEKQACALLGRFGVRGVEN